MSRGVTGFFGIPEEDETLQQRRQNEWKERSCRMHSSSMFLRGHKRTHAQPESTSAAAVSAVSFSSLLCRCCRYAMPKAFCFYVFHSCVCVRMSMHPSVCPP